MGGIRSSYIVSSAADVLRMSVMGGIRGVSRVCEMCMYLAWSSVESGRVSG